MNTQYWLDIENHILQQYQIKNALGQGSYGKVWLAIDRSNNKKYAIKKIYGAFRDSVDAKRTVREVSFLYQLSHHQNIVRLEKVIQSQNSNDLYLVFEYVSSDLHQVIHSTTLVPIQQRFIIYQILKALDYIHSGGLIHRDLKPSNILISTNCQIKLADFGLARTFQDTDETTCGYTQNVATKVYRAPEILFHSKIYTSKVDMWSMGCILYEMLSGQALFNSDYYFGQIGELIQILGVPNRRDIQSFKLGESDSQELEQLTSGVQKKTPRLNEMISNFDPFARDFIRNCLKYNPIDRMSASEALKHPYFQHPDLFDLELINQRCGASPPSPVDQFITLKNDNYSYSVQEYKDVLDRFIKFRNGNIYQFKTEYNQNISTQSSQNIIQTPYTTVSAKNKPTQLFHSPKLQQFQIKNRTQSNYFESNKSCSLISEQKNNTFHKPLINKITKKMPKNELEAIKNKYSQRNGRRQSLLTNCSQGQSPNHGNE
ncbi:unnamed protein product [Paramecium octaurelia]|uniref:Mitogen-activated protein kinase n=1 Tax=Paramecium octaurelia TaxID=43137 RepID=A0A8S1XMD7_PAROT|nr:unnamed protein product [Paramecium octaurelia]